MDNVERCQKLRIKRERICLDEPERIIGLRLNIYADNLKSGLVVADRGTAGATEKVEKVRLASIAIAHSLNAPPSQSVGSEK